MLNTSPPYKFVNDVSHIADKEALLWQWCDSHSHEAGKTCPQQDSTSSHESSVRDGSSKLKYEPGRIFREESFFALAPRRTFLAEASWSRPRGAPNKAAILTLSGYLNSPGKGPPAAARLPSNGDDTGVAEVDNEEVCLDGVSTRPLVDSLPTPCRHALESSVHVNAVQQIQQEKVEHRQAFAFTATCGVSSAAEIDGSQASTSPMSQSTKPTSPSASELQSCASVMQPDDASPLHGNLHVNTDSAEAAAADDVLPQLESEEEDILEGPLPSVGSIYHAAGQCKRCCFHPRGRCTNGYLCTFCHYDHELRKKKGKKKRSKKTHFADVAGKHAVADNRVATCSSACQIEPTSENHIFMTVPLSAPRVHGYVDYVPSPPTWTADGAVTIFKLI